ncbi:MAG: PDZ domain-containing protein [Corynebacterium sp.]|nr:PDZ domain-containing protein [Corynebacterium sp.]
MKLRLQTIALGALPLLVLGTVVSVETIPGTDIHLTVPYVAEGPGPMYNTLGDIEGVDIIDVTGAEVDDTTGSLSMTTVAVRSNMTFMQTLERWLVEGDTIIPREHLYPANYSEEDIQHANEQAFSQSEANATSAALNYLKMPIYSQVETVQDEGAAADILEPGDVIVKFEGEDISSPAQLSEAVSEQKPGAEVSLTYVRDDAEHTTTLTLGDDDGQARIGISLSATPAEGVTVEYRLKDVGGPSAGMIFSLALIDKLSEGELTGGRDVAGTGTISEDGTVGPIGGIAHKITAAKEQDTELFLAPAGNCAEAISVDAGDMVIAKVETLEDAIAAMDDFAAGKDVPTCS